MQRNNAIDIAKGIGIIFVLWGHTYCPVKPYFYVFHMPLFFLLSGFFFKNDENIKVTLKKKLRSLGIPFFFFFLFQRIGFIVISLIGGTFKSDYLLIWNPIFPWDRIGVLWFLVALFVVTMIFSLINKLSLELYKFSACFILTLTGYLLYVNNIHLPAHLDSSLSMMLFFYLGNRLSAINLNKIGTFKNWIFVGLASLTLYSVCINLHLPTIDVSLNVFEGKFLFTFGIMILGCLMVLIFSKIIDYIPHIKTGMAYIGKQSLAIYVTHTVILEAIYLVFPREKNTTIGGMSMVVFTLGVCLLLNIVLQKYVPFVFGQKKKPISVIV